MILFQGQGLSFSQIRQATYSALASKSSVSLNVLQLVSGLVFWLLNMMSFRVSGSQDESNEGAGH